MVCDCGTPWTFLLLFFNHGLNGYKTLAFNPDRVPAIYVDPCTRVLMVSFSKFYRRHSALLEKFNVSLKPLLQQGISEPEFYGDLVYRFRKIVGKSNFSEQFRKLINRYKRIGYSLDIMRQTACLVVNPIIVDGYASLFNYTTAVRASDSMTASS